MRIRLLTLAILTSVVSVRAMPRKMPYTEKQFEMAVACIKHFEGWHNMKEDSEGRKVFRKNDD